MTLYERFEQDASSNIEPTMKCVNKSFQTRLRSKQKLSLLKENLNIWLHFLKMWIIWNLSQFEIRSVSASHSFQITHKLLFALDDHSSSLPSKIFLRNGYGRGFKKENQELRFPLPPINPKRVVISVNEDNQEKLRFPKDRHGNNVIAVAQCFSIWMMIFFWGGGVDHLKHCQRHNGPRVLTL